MALRIVTHLMSLWLMLLSLRLSSTNPLDIEKSSMFNCSEGLTHCTLKECRIHFGWDGALNVSQVYVKVVLNCIQPNDCKPCLRIKLSFTVGDEHDDQDISEDHSGDVQSSGYKELKEDRDRSGCLIQTTLPDYSFVKVCYAIPNFERRCKIITFRLSQSTMELKDPHEIWWLTDPIEFGTAVIVDVSPYSRQYISVPSLQHVCPQNLEGYIVKKCDAPRLQIVSDNKREIVILKLDPAKVNKNNDTVMLLIDGTGNSATFSDWKGQTKISIPLRSVAPCTCFEVWWKSHGEYRQKYCPYKHRQDLFMKMRGNISVTVLEAPLSRGPVLIWNLTAPCRLNAEVWPCRRDLAGGQCNEVKGFREKIFDNQENYWTPIRHGHWESGQFINLTRHPALCIQVNVNGMDLDMEPFCPFAETRGRWILPMLISLLLICLVILGSYVMQVALKGFMWKWLKEEDIKGAVGGGHMVLLYPPDEDQALPGLVCRLGSSLQALGFGVSVDLWSQAELNMLGPVPWLHSRLDQLKRQGGRVVLVLTQAAWGRAEEWGRQGMGRRDREQAGKEKESGRGFHTASPYSDVFSASLSCILADYLQGRAGERFVLVQFEALPPQPSAYSSPLPELFRGLPLFSLPSQSLAFLTELVARGQGSAASVGRRKRAGGLRAASRALAGGLRGFTGASTVLRLPALSQDCVGAVEDPWETEPLDPCLDTSP